MVHHIRGNPLAEVGLEAVHAHVQELLQALLIPAHCLRVGEVHHSHAGLPHIPLPYAAVRPLYEVSLFHSLVEQSRFLSDIRIDPDADFDPFIMNPAKHPLRIRKHCLVPDKIRPVEFFHPAAVKVEYGQRNSPLQHPVDKAHDGGLVVICGKGGGQPQAESPGRGQGGFSGEIRIPLQHLFHGGAV